MRAATGRRGTPPERAPNGFEGSEELTPFGDRPPLEIRDAVRAVMRSVVKTPALLATRRIHRPRAHVGDEVRFADGTSAVIYRETVIRRPPTRAPAVLVVAFRLRWVRGRGHAMFRAESLLNTPLFVGFPGLVSKLWLTHDAQGRYRGLYEWDDPTLADAYARALWRVLSLVCPTSSIHYAVLPGLRRDDVLGGADHSLPGDAEWWRPGRVFSG